MLQPGFRGSRFLVRYPCKKHGRLHSVSHRTHRYSMAVFIKMPACAIGGMRRFINLAIFLPANFADCFLRTGSCAALMCRIFVYSVTTWIGTRLPMPIIVVRPLRSPLMYVMICSDYFSARRYRRWRLYPCISSREIYVPLHSFESDIVDIISILPPLRIISSTAVYRPIFAELIFDRTACNFDFPSDMPLPFQEPRSHIAFVDDNLCIASDINPGFPSSWLG